MQMAGRDILTRLRQLDAYPKTLEDFRIKTFSGATGEMLEIAKLIHRMLVYASHGSSDGRFPNSKSKTRFFARNRKNRNLDIFRDFCSIFSNAWEVVGLSVTPV